MKRTNIAAWIEKRKYWQIKVQKNGERRTFTRATPGRVGQRNANAKADAWLEEGIKNQKVRVEREYPIFLEEKKNNTCYHNWRTMSNRWGKWIKPQIKNKLVIELCDEDLQNVLNAAFKKKPLAKKTLQNIRGDMSSFVKFCRRERLTTYVPDDVTIPAKAEESAKTILQPEGLIKLFSCDLSVDHHKLIKEPYINAYRYQVLTGLRPGEVLGFMKSDLLSGIFLVRRSIDIDGNITPGKNKNAQRSQVLTEAEKRVLADQKELVEQLGLDDSLYVFGIKSQQDYRNHLKRYCKANGIPPVTPYELRHTFVSIAKILPEGLVKPLVGHSVNMDTFGIYGHFLKGDGDKTAALLGNVFDQLLALKLDVG